MMIYDRIKHLEEQLELVSSPKDELRLLNELAWELRIINENRARELANRAYHLSESKTGSKEPIYQQERAASLVTLGALDRHSGELDVALSQFYSGLTLLEGFPPSKVTCQALTGIAWTYSYLGDYLKASDFAARAVDMARKLKLNDHEAFALDVQASVYYLSGEPEQAFVIFTEAIDILEKSKNLYIKCFVLNNMSLTLMALSNFDAALASAQESLRLAREQSLQIQELNAGDTIAQILLEMGNYAEAESYLTDALSKTEKNKFDIFQVYMLSNLGKVYLKQNNFQTAASILQRAVLAAATIGARGDEAICHKLLSEAFENLELYREGLVHFKKFYQMNEAVIGEKVAKRLSLQRTAHELENVRRDAELQRLRSVRLEREMDVQKRTQAILERLANLDPLTEIYNRRHFKKLAMQEIRQSIRSKQSISLLMIDIDHFKHVNDQHGHSVGDQVIGAVASLIHEILRNMDIVGRLGGDEFAVIFPDTSSHKSVLVAERIRLQVGNLPFQSESGEFSISISIGAACSEGLSGSPTEILDQLLNIADNALYEAKSKGRNQTILI